MNPDTNRFEKLTSMDEDELQKLKDRAAGMMETIAEVVHGQIFRPNGEPVPKHWTKFSVGERVVIKDYTFKVCYIGETSILFEPIGQADMIVDSAHENEE